MALEYEAIPVNSAASSLSALSSNSEIHDDKSGDDLSPEDIAWIDSCLIKEPETSAIKWDLNSSKAHMSTKAMSSETEFHEEIESDEMVVEEEPSQLPKSEGGSEEILSPVEDEEVNDQRPLSFHRNPFLPTYSEESEAEAEAETVSSPRSDPRSTTVEDVTETSPKSDEIFRVWDLNVPAEENELGVQLKNVLADDASGASEDLRLVSIDDVIDRVSKISLSSSDSSP